MSEQSGSARLQKCTTTFKVTVFRSRKTRQVLFLEADKDFVDTLFSFLVLPMGTITNVVSQAIQVNSLGGISCLFESLDPSFMNVDKEHLMQSRPAVADCTCQPNTSGRFHQDLVTAEMMQPPRYRSSYSVNGHYPIGGFVKENIKFMVTDKLEVIPSSFKTSMSLLKKLEITSVNDQESDEITVSITQIVELLHSALISKKCLSDVFGKKREDSGFSGTGRDVTV